MEQAARDLKLSLPRALLGVRTACDTVVHAVDSSMAVAGNSVGSGKGDGEIPVASTVPYHT
jgi:hypothetical protein